MGDMEYMNKLILKINSPKTIQRKGMQNNSDVESRKSKEDLSFAKYGVSMGQKGSFVFMLPSYYYGSH